MYKILLFLVCGLLTSCVSTSKFGTTRDGNIIYKTVCHSGGIPDIVTSQSECMDETKKYCLSPQNYAIARGHDSMGYFYEILYTCNQVEN